MFAALIGVTVALAAAFTALAYRRGWRWTGLPADPGDGTPSRSPRQAKTLWDWLQLLIVPLVLSLAALLLNTAQADRDRAASEDRARADTLSAYLQQMSDLVIRHGLRSGQGLRSAAGKRADSDARLLARTLTLTALRQLDTDRKRVVLQFLIEGRLITRKSVWRRGEVVRRTHPRVHLAGADLHDVVMPLLAQLLSFERTKTVAVGADLDGTDLRHADFHMAGLSGVTMEGADLRDADFSGADIRGASFWASCLSGARFVRATGEAPGADFMATEGRGVDFTGASLTNADFTDARLTTSIFGTSKPPEHSGRTGGLAPASV
jgi:uncharacterized protein YjbI with pentapeptide repeats